MQKIFLPLAFIVFCISSSAKAEQNFDFERLTVEAQRLILRGGQYLAQDCFEPDFSFKGYDGLPVRKCNYSELGNEATVALLLADSEKISSWIETACRKFAPRSLSRCAETTFSAMWQSSNAQIPISGIVIEPRSVVTGDASHAKTPMNFVFRDGVTVRTALELNGTTRQLSYIEMEQSSVAEVVKAFKFARPIGATREMLVDFGAPSSIITDTGEFLRYLRTSHAEAWSSDEHNVVSAWVLNQNFDGGVSEHSQ